MRSSDRREYVGALRTREETAEVIDLAARCFGNYEQMAGFLRRAAYAPGFHDPEFTRIVRARGRIVSMAMMIPRTLRFGPARVPAVTMGPICTDLRHRRRGHAAAVMHNAIDFLRSRGILLAYLGGIPDFYHRFGFYPYRWEYALKATVRDCLEVGAPGRLRKLVPRDRPSAGRVYDMATRDWLCAADRPPQVWDWLLRLVRHHAGWPFPAPRAILHARGRFIGYFTTEGAGDTLTCRETIVEPTLSSFTAALGAIARFARKHKKTRLEFRAPPHCAFARFLSAHVPAEMSLRTHPGGGPLMSVVDVERLIATLAPLLQQRLGATLAARSTAFTLRSGTAAVGFAWRAGRLAVGRPRRGAVADVAPRYFSGLLTGFYAVRTLAGCKGVTIPDRLIEPMEALFPAGYPMVAAGDDM